MITKIIHWSILNRIWVLLITALIVLAGGFAIKNTAVDAIPDLSDVQVIIKTSYPGQAPQVVQDQVTYPLTTAMLSVPGAKTVRGYSFFGDSYVYIIFDDNTDLYWARSRVLEYLSQITDSLPNGAKPQLGPDATGVGWVFIYALTDTSGNLDLAELRSLQDWFLKYELQTVAGVSEVAAVGGMIKQYQVRVDPHKLRAYGIPLSLLETAIQQGNQEVGASVIEMAEAEYMIRATGYISSREDLENIPLGMVVNGQPLFLTDVADIVEGPQMRRGVSELDGKGEVVGGIVVMRSGENAQKTIAAVKEKLDQLKAGLPAGVELVTVYDRSDLINAAIENLWQKLAAELIMVALACILFLFHVRSALVAIISLPIGILIAFIIMYLQGLNANIMSLAGIAIAIGAMVDGAIVMIENMHKHMERALVKTKETLTNENRWQIVAKAASEVGPSLFFSLLIITVSFLPVFTLEAQEGKLFSPLAFTKTYAMAAAAILAITLVPVLMGYFIRGKIISENKNPLNRMLIAIYQPLLSRLLKFPKTTLLLALTIVLLSLYPASKIGSEFMPDLDEGDLMYMPTTYAGLSVGKAREILQQTDKLIATVPEVEHVFGKIGRADTATDPAPLTMIETFIKLKPKDQWREGLTSQDLRNELDQLIQFPGLTNAWVMPIKTRIDMLATGIKTPVGIKVSGPDLIEIQKIGQQLEQVLADVKGTASVYSERVVGGRYIKIDIQRRQAAQYGMSIKDVQQIIGSAIGGKNIAESVEGDKRYPINLRYPQHYRDSPEQLERLPIITKAGYNITLGDVANIRIEEGPPMIKSENARINGWTYIDIETEGANAIDIGSYVKNAQKIVAEKIELGVLTIPAGYSIRWAGQYEYMQRAKEKLSYVVPLTLGVIILLLYLNFRNVRDVALILLTLPMGLVGGILLMSYYQFNFSVAVGVGFIALAGVAAETGVIMLQYLKQAIEDEKPTTVAMLQNSILDGAVNRVRPVMMTAIATIAGLVPVMYGTGIGSEVMSRIAAPMLGGMISVVILTLLILPVAYYQTIRVGQRIKTIL
ncbi:MAG: efflux RND transporter permease subunit [Oleispira antarctica]|nr:efflux RND transporter permease subunit [Oleispira antarctica]MBQ0791571.1 efflux RND transporter permease subunit [Oleispira antarctica]